MNNVMYIDEGVTPTAGQMQSPRGLRKIIWGGQNLNAILLPRKWKCWLQMAQPYTVMQSELKAKVYV